MTQPKHAGGRPTKYRADMPERVDAYVEKCASSETVCLPTREGFALDEHIAFNTVLNWSKDHEGFLRALDRLDHAQRGMLMNNGLSGDYNSTIAKLILSSNHGMAERSKSEVDLKGRLTIEEILIQADAE